MKAPKSNSDTAENALAHQLFWASIPQELQEAISGGRGNLRRNPHSRAEYTA